MRAIVLVKQVPDVRVGAVGMHPDGTIDRSSSRAITNPADLHAIEAALQLADEVWAVSMGPKNAEAALREAIALGADRGVLLSDRLFAGSDTWATANALSAAIPHLGEPELILAGISALDGETGHVGPQVAQRLGIDLATGCEDVTINGQRLTVRRIVEGGYELLSIPTPCLLTIAETGFTPRYPTLPGRRRAARADIEVLTAADLDLDATLVGLKASPTKVAHMEAVPLAATECRFVDDRFTLDDLATEILTHTPREKQRLGTSTVREEKATTTRQFSGDPGIWVVCETRDEGLGNVSTELLSKSVELAERIDDGVAALVIGADPSKAKEDAAYFGADLVMTARDHRLAVYRGRPEARLIAEAARVLDPGIVLFGATTTGRDLAPRVAGILDTGIAADCTDLYIDDWERRGEVHKDLLHQVRPAMAGGVLATCLCPVARPQIATVRPGVFPAVPHPRQPSLCELDVAIEPEDLSVEVLELHLQEADVHLSDADVVVAGGAGCDARNWHLIEELAAELEGSVAASRAAVEAGLAPRSAQVGQTGTTVRPQLYIACGISGALQHVVGMRASRTIVAINRDPNAPLFHFAHYGVVGDVAEVLPRLTSAIASQRR